MIKHLLSKGLIKGIVISYVMNVSAFKRENILCGIYLNNLSQAEISIPLLEKEAISPENIIIEFGSFTTQRRKKLDLEISKFQELAQIGDKKDSFEVLLGGTVSGALRRTGFEIGAG